MKKYINYSLILIATLTCFVYQVSNVRANDSDAIATVNGESISRNNLEALVSFNAPKLQNASGSHGAGAGGGMHGAQPSTSAVARDVLRNKLLAQRIDTELMYQHSKAFPVDGLEKKVDDQFNSIVKQYGSADAFEKLLSEQKISSDMIKLDIEKEITVQNYIDTELLPSITVSEEEMKKAYDNNLEKFVLEAKKVRASHILLNIKKGATDEEKSAVKAKITELREKLVNGADFAEIAKEYSECDTAPAGGDIGFIGKGETVKPFEDTVFSAEIGVLSEVLEASYGCHIIKVTDIKDTKYKSFDDVRDLVERSLKKQYYNEKIAKLLEELKGKAKIEMFN